MRKSEKKIMFGLLFLALMAAMLFQVPVKAAKKKLKVNKVYTTSTRVKGTTKAKYKIKIKIGKKTYKGKANKKGKFSVKIKKQKKNKKIYVKVYKKNGKYYTKKKVTVVKKKAAKPSSSNSSNSNNEKKQGYYIGDKKYTGKVPGYEDSIDVDDFFNWKVSKLTLLNIKYYNADGSYNWEKSYSNCINEYGQGEKGYTDYYLTEDTNNVWEFMTAHHGVTLYYNRGTESAMNTIKTPTPTDYEGKITSGQTAKLNPSYRSKNTGRASISFKMVGYKNGKPVMAYSSAFALGAGTIVAPK
ncbi:MAG: hypothetical protein PHT76_14790 [Anaerostipes sp.]|nr:hypothetical protein [Anaerostipes sp.]